MNGFYGLIKRFGRDESGVFAVLFGLMAIILIALGGSVVDYVRLEQTRNRAQVALDAAALALQPEIFKVPVNQASIKANAQALMIERIADPVVAAAIETITVDVPNGSLFFEAKIAVPTIFVQLVGVPQMTARIHSEATRKKLSIEVAMVLDNSGSMATSSYNSTTKQNETRMYNLKIAATCATNIIFYGSVQSDTNCTPATGTTASTDVKMGVVPFTMYVNIGAGNANASWIDAAGASVTANDNFDDDDDDSTPFTGQVNRFTLYNQISNDNWRGCVEARPHISSGGANYYLDTDDTLPVAGNTKFVPLFAPDLPEGTSSLGNYNNYTSDTPAACNATGTCSRIATQLACNSSFSNCLASVGLYSLSGPNSGNQSCTCNNPTVTTWVNVTTGSPLLPVYTRTRIESCNFSYAPQGLSQRELQERLCKYNGAMSYTTNQKGPNADCPATSLLPLTGTPATVKTAITNMVADGGTNIHEGTAWGFRALSPTLPFTEGKPYDAATAKVMIVMTDGENTAYRGSSSSLDSLNGSAYFSAYGYPYNSRNTNANSSSSGNIERLGSIGSTNSQLVNEMNARTLQACANAKAEGITIYTIGLSTDEADQSTPAVVRKMLTDCASTTDKAYFPAQPSELKSVFLAIAGQLAALRLAQ